MSINIDIDNDMSYGENKKIYITSNDLSGSSDERSIYRDLIHLDIPDDIKREADNLYKKANIPIKRGKKRLFIIYYFLDCAYDSLNIECNPKDLACLVGIEPTEIRTATSLGSRYNESFCPKFKIKTPYNFISSQFMCSNLSLECLPDINKLCDRILKINTDLKDERPQYVSAAIILYYMIINGIHIDKYFYEKINISEGVLQSIKKRIAIADNS